jgi:hypothetical protein
VQVLGQVQGSSTKLLTQNPEHNLNKRKNGFL